MKAFLMLCICSLLLSGCWSSRELNELAITVAVGIDKAEDGIIVTVQLINPGDIQAKTPTNGPSVTTFSIKASSVMEGLRKITTKSPREIYLSHLRMLVISESMAEEGIAEVLDFFARDHEVRTDYFVVVAKNTKASSVLNVLTTIEKIPANHMFASLDVSQRIWAPTRGVKLNELISNLTSEGKQAVLSGVLVKGNVKNAGDMSSISRTNLSTLLNFKGLGVFQNDKLIGWFNEDESKGYNYITGNVKSTLIVIPCEKKEKKHDIIGVEMLRTNVKVTATMKNHKPHIHVDLKGEANVADVECQVNLQDPAVINMLERKTAADVKEKMNDAVEKAQKTYKSDIFGFGEAFYRQDVKRWYKMKREWNRIYAEDLTVDLDAKVQIRRLGTLNNSYMKQMKH
ncbi:MULTISPECIES: Ger(x)C family spore germination protein [Priestia]|uniref:Spore germination protein KC n=3 Tax=Priestia TaxID=2800373 RepID=D5DZE0_PRIM1|nr:MULTISPECIES: Ger(x)C family spore germination protein [Priestia]ADE68304.1 spore germination protein KC [Priestia megaterium QM B1551]MBA9039530.1 spore germination protein KC [Priestia aryabhattai]MBG9934311.1 spore gernimation protein LC [Priestia aryabhattai]MED4091219.1 Ger(x)C family spore germination protein [Priestia megaterium]MUL31340.1 Spore germination protein A3 precursor [Priestia megaterium]